MFYFQYLETVQSRGPEVEPLVIYPRGNQLGIAITDLSGFLQLWKVIENLQCWLWNWVYHGKDTKKILSILILYNSMGTLSENACGC